MWGRRTRRTIRTLLAAAVMIAASTAGLGLAAADAAPAFGQQRALVLRVTWAGADASGSAGLDDMITAGVDPWMSTASRGVFTGWTVADPGVLTIPQPSLSAAPTPCDNTFLHALEGPVEQAALGLGYDYRNYDVVVYWFPAQPCGWFGNGDTGGLRVHLNGIVSRSVLVHELGHHLGLGHGHQLECRDGTGNQVPLSTDCTSNEYGDFIDEMGTGFGTYSAPQLAYLGWLDGLVATAPPTGGGYLISPLDSQPPGTGVHALRIPDGNETIWVEYRQPGNLDDSPYDQGVLIHLQRPDGLVTTGSYLLRMAPTLRAPQLPTGSGWTDPLGHARITLDYANSQAAHVTVTSTLKQVPNLTSMTLTAAGTALANAGLTLGDRSTVNNCVDPGTVQNQAPSAGDLVDPGTPVSVTLSTCKRTGGGGGLPV